MYNVFQYDLSKAQADLVASEEAKRERRNRSAQHIKDKMVQKYKQRVVRNVAMMSLEPVHKMTVYEKPFVGEAFFRHRAKDSSERVQDNLDANKWLDTIPNPKPTFRLRKRTPSKEIHSDMRFQPKDRFERLKDSWNYQKDILNSTWTISPRTLAPESNSKIYNKTIETFANEVSVDDPEIVRIAKHARSAMRSPAHFKSISTNY